MMASVRAWRESPAGRRRLVLGGACAVLGGGGLVLLVAWAYGVHVIAVIVRAVFLAFSSG